MVSLSCCVHYRLLYILKILSHPFVRFYLGSLSFQEKMQPIDASCCLLFEVIYFLFVCTIGVSVLLLHLLLIISFLAITLLKFNGLDSILDLDLGESMLD